MRHTTARVALAGAMAVGLAGAPATSAGAASAEPASGEFAVTDITSFTLQPARGNKCEVTVTGTLSFTGTLDGDAVGTTTAYVFAPCSEVGMTMPGTHFDVFRFEGGFTGTVGGTPVVDAPLSYSGVTRPGGLIDASIRLKDGAMAVLRADARVLVGGTYSGVAKG